ncbi:hypothetical protein JMJ58_03410 [Haloterrigena salifodinae]|uniref:Uncharacterized protein n=1 Tax=Haloterrigena salifodinae TaxID=2675099 RepID=A0A8T8E2H2_9EURY|nr:hypothetical protein [Haloterrigena salifodinae]QRV15958.1 hypothetical protein JMJ58_03410 [Haloterrigena salifodinae]
MITAAVTTLNRHREKVSLVGYFVVMLGLTLPLATMLGSAYEDGKLTRSLIDLHLLVDAIDLEGVSVFLLGIFIGLLILLTIDPKKRWQGYLLWIGLVISLLGLWTIGLFIPNIDFTSTTNLGWLAVGILLGLVLGGGRKLLRTQTAQAFEFRSAAKGIYLIVALLIVSALIETHLVYPTIFEITADGVSIVSSETSGVSVETDGLARNAVLSGIFIHTVRRFIQYDSEEDFFVLGPRGSGKSLFLIGAYLEALNRGRNDEATKQTPLQPSQELMKMVENLDQRSEGWLIEATGRGEIKDLAFQYVHGSTFPKNVKVSSIDYAGEYLSRLPDALSGAVTEDDADNTLLRLSDGVEDADTLILLVDLERYANGESLDISEYFSILQAANDKGIFVVATKADVFIEDFQKEQGIEPHLAFDEFKDFVNQRLRQSEQIDSLIRQTAGAEIHPVYYQTTENENGDRVPMRDETGSVMTIGFDRLLNELGR